jgi:tRNA nucleotidyltransferase (CCA-adding enzyme)
VLIFAALTHDFGKATTTRLRRKANGEPRWTSYGHDHAGGPLAEAFLQRLGIDEAIVERVARLVEQHMAYRAFAESGVGDFAVRRLRWRLQPATLDELLWLIEADHSGRPPLPKGLPPAALRLARLAEEQKMREDSPHPEEG